MVIAAAPLAFGVLASPDALADASAQVGHHSQSVPSVPTDSDAPFDEPDSDPNAPADGEEIPQSSDAERAMAQGRKVAPHLLLDAALAGLASPSSAREFRVKSPFDPDGLDRPPRV